MIFINPCALNMSISALACAIAEGKNENEIDLLSAFFNQLGECLATISAAQACNNSSNSNNNSCIQKRDI